MRMLDNVVDLNFYPTKEAQKANMSHRPVGAGTMGWADVFHSYKINFSSKEAVRLSDELYEFISYHCLLNSNKLAKERGKYSSYEGSKWSEGILPIDTYKNLMDYLEEKPIIYKGKQYVLETDWRALRDDIGLHGMRNSNTMAIAPTATISYIQGCSPSVESDPVDLEAWFADRDVQTYVESLEKKGALGIAKSSFSFLSSFSGEKPEVDDSEEDLESNTNLPMPGGVPDYEEEETDFGQFNWQEFFHGRIQDPILKILSKRTSSILGASLGLLLVGLGASLGVFDFRDDPLKSIRTNNQIAVEEPITSKPEREEPLQEMKKPELNLLIASEPSEEEIKRLIQFWLNGKAKVLAGQESEELPIVARSSLVERVQLERTKDLKRKEIQRINTSINSFKLVSQTPKRIEVKVNLSYSDQRLKSTGEIVSETSIPSLKVTYILGREKNLWQLVDYISGS